MPLMPAHSPLQTPAPSGSATAWHDCRFLTASVLPVRVACNLRCPFCFSRSSISRLAAERVDWRALPVDEFFAFSRDRGATRLVITGGGEPLLRPRDSLWLVERGARFFDEMALFTNGAFLTRELATNLASAGLSYVCFSRHHFDEERNRQLMGRTAPLLAEFFAAAEPLKVRATCVMCRDFIANRADVWQYIAALAGFGVREFTFKHTYVAYSESVFRGSAHDDWAMNHQIDANPFAADDGDVIASLPWGPEIRRIGPNQVCFYFEPNPAWELENQLCRSSNLLSDGRIYASLEDQRSLLFRLKN